MSRAGAFDLLVISLAAEHQKVLIVRVHHRSHLACRISQLGKQRAFLCLRGWRQSVFGRHHQHDGGNVRLIHLQNRAQGTITEILDLNLDFGERYLDFFEILVHI